MPYSSDKPHSITVDRRRIEFIVGDTQAVQIIHDAYIVTHQVEKISGAGIQQRIARIKMTSNPAGGILLRLNSARR